MRRRSHQNRIYFPLGMKISASVGVCVCVCWGEYGMIWGLAFYRAIQWKVSGCGRTVRQFYWARCGRANGERFGLLINLLIFYLVLFIYLYV